MLTATTDPQNQRLDLTPLYFPWDPLHANCGLLIHRPDPIPTRIYSDTLLALDAGKAPRFNEPEAFATGFRQIVGHTTHTRMLRLFANTSVLLPRDALAAGEIRCLSLMDSVRYQRATTGAMQEKEVMICIDGEMGSNGPTNYQLLELRPQPLGGL